MSGNHSRTARRAQAGTTEAPWVRWTLISLALAFMLLSVLVDFTSTILSIASDAMLIGAAGYLIHLAFKEVSKKQ